MLIAMPRVQFRFARFCLAAVLMCLVVAGAASAGPEIHLGDAGSLVECTTATLHSGTCIDAVPGRIVALTDATDADGNRCAPGRTGRGTEYVLCRFDGNAWQEFGADTSSATAAAALGAGQLVLDILNPPPGSGLAPPVGDGIDGKPNAPRTDAAPAINAAIQYACDNGYDIAYLGPGTYRIGVDQNASFYTGIRIDASLCPNGIKFFGAGIGRTNLLANGGGGQYVIFTADQYVDHTKVRRMGWNVLGGDQDPNVIGITTGVSPPVVTGDGPSYLVDGDTVLIRNCSGASLANERRFKVNACTDVEPYTCELQDESGVDADATDWGAFNTNTECIVHKLNPKFITEIAYMTVRDDVPEEHMRVLCSPLCTVIGEESHGIGILQGGGVVEVHDVMIDRMGDEAIDISAPESPTYIHDVTVLNAVHGGTPVYQGVGVRIEDVWVHKSEASDWIFDDVGSPEFIAYTAGDAMSVSPGAKNWRVVDLHVNRLVATGLLGVGVGVFVNVTGEDGQYISGVKVTNSIVNLNPNPFHCDGPFEVCGSVEVQAKLDMYPMENIEFSNNVMTGTAFLDLALGDGGLLFKDNIVTPIPTIPRRWGLVASAKATVIEGTSISGFERGCIQFRPYETNGGSNATITMTIRDNVLACKSNSVNRDPMIGSVAPGLLPHATDDGYFHVEDNQFLAGSQDFIRHAVKTSESWKGVRICGNQISFNPAANISGTIGIWSESEDQLICENTIQLRGNGIRVSGDRSIVSGNFIQGFDDDFASGIQVIDSSDTLVVNNEIVNYRNLFSSGITVDAGAAAQQNISLIGNDVGAAGSAIEIDGMGVGLDKITISGNRVDMNGFTPSSGILLNDATNVHVIVNDLVGLGGVSADALLTTGTTDFVTVRDNLAEGGGTFKFGTSGGDASCDPDGGVGDNSTCSGNTVQ